MDAYKYKVSVIMAVYNVEQFLRESIDSVIAQDIGFEHIQLILVDDGTPDGSGAICDEYAEKYPDNIVVIHKENGGVSSARNAGLDVAEGELVNFLDSDDTMTPETFRAVYEFYKAHQRETDIVVVPMHFFDGETGQHTLNYKFQKGNRVIDLDKEWGVCQLQSGATFVNRACVQELRFDQRLSYAEDANFLQRVLAGKCAMGVVKTGKYMYRKRTTGAESALQSAKGKLSWYIPYFKYFQEETIRFYMEKFGQVPRFIQYVLMYDIQWRLRMEHIQPDVLTAEEEAEFYSRLFGVLRYIDDEVILAQRNIFTEQKVFALEKKYAGHQTQIRDNDIVQIYGKTVGAKLSEGSCRLEFIDIKNGVCRLEGRVAVVSGLEENLNFYLCANQEMYPCEAIAPEISKYSLGEPILYMCGFRGEIPLDEKDNTVEISVFVEKEGRLIPMKKFSLGTFFPVNNQKYRNAYAIQDGWKINCWYRTVSLSRVAPGEAAKCELRLIKELWKKNGLGERKAAIARILRKLLFRNKRKPMWLISDRAAKAGDNGEALFRYVRENHPEIDAYFVIAKDCSDYQRMAAVGPVLVKDSFKHKLYTLACDYILSSHAEVDVYNPFAGYSEPYRDYLARNKFIFLQHGITHNDLSDWLDRYKKNLYGFIAAAKPEAKSVLDYNYHYAPEHVWLTGFPRFDRLYRAEEKFITIMPTWRRYLFGVCSRETKVWSIGNVFLESEYFAFFNGLLNHPRLLEAARKYGYTIGFFPHPNVADHMDVFTKNDQVVFMEKSTEYRDVYARSNLILTDYSSAVFDFAYLRKPIIYAQFDKETFYSGAHTLAQGYFDYERDGFGEVEYTLESTVDRLIEYMENNCELKDEYRRRVDGFFAFDDKNNCKRVFDKIMELETND